VRAVAVGPFDGRGVLVVMTDVTMSLRARSLTEVKTRGDHLAFDAAEPEST